MKSPQKKQPKKHSVKQAHQQKAKHAEKPITSHAVHHVPIKKYPPLPQPPLSPHELAHHLHAQHPTRPVHHAYKEKHHQEKHHESKHPDPKHVVHHSQHASHHPPHPDHAKHAQSQHVQHAKSHKEPHADHAQHNAQKNHHSAAHPHHHDNHHTHKQHAANKSPHATQAAHHHQAHHPTQHAAHKQQPPAHDKNVLEHYPIVVDGAKVEVSVRKIGDDLIYYLAVPEIDVATATLLTDIRNELISLTTISMKELTDPEYFSTIKQRFMNDATNLMRKKLPKIDKDVERFLVGILMQEMLGLGRIEFLVNDATLEEIVIPSAKEPIRVYNKRYGWLQTNLKLEKEEEIVNYANIIARRVGKQITVLSPLLDAHLLSGDRINAVLYPINTKGNTITIRKFARDPYTIVDLINNKTCDLDCACLLWIALEYEMNVLFSGGTASGKTSILNACMPFIPPNQRVLSIEDTRELMLPEFLYWTPLVTRTPNPEGKGEVNMLDLLVNSLRMRPDRIILGEMRKREEATVLFEAMHTGHSVYATLHADSATETISRLVNAPLSIPPNLLRAVHLNVVMFRDRRRGIRRVLQIAEFDAEKDEAKANILYRWSQEEDRIVPHSESSRFYEDLSRNTGMSQSDIDSNLKEKKNILAWLAKNNIRALQDIGKVMHLYYKNKEFLITAMNKNDPKLVLA